MDIKTPLGNKNMKSLSFRDNNQHASPKLCSQIFEDFFSSCEPCFHRHKHYKYTKNSQKQYLRINRAL